MDELLPKRPKVIIVGRANRMLALVVIVGFVSTAFLAVIGLDVGVDGRTIRCGSPFSPLNTLDFSDALDCSRALDTRRFLTLLVFVATAICFALFAGSLLVSGRPTGGPTRGRNVTVRAAVPKDAAAVEATIDETVIEEMGWTDAEVEQCVADVRSGVGGSTLVVVDDMTRTVGGVITVAFDPSMAQCFRIGFWAGPKHRGRGVMTDAVGAIVAELVRVGGSVRAETAATNLAAQRVIEQAGLTLSGRTTVRLPNGSFVDAKVYTHFAEIDTPGKADSEAETKPEPGPGDPVEKAVWGPPSV